MCYYAKITQPVSQTLQPWETQSDNGQYRKAGKVITTRIFYKPKDAIVQTKNHKRCNRQHTNIKLCWQKEWHKIIWKAMK